MRCKRRNGARFEHKFIAFSNMKLEFLFKIFKILFFFSKFRKNNFIKYIFLPIDIKEEKVQLNWIMCFPCCSTFSSQTQPMLSPFHSIFARVFNGLEFFIVFKVFWLTITSWVSFYFAIQLQLLDSVKFSKKIVRN